MTLPNPCCAAAVPLLWVLVEGSRLKAAQNNCEHEQSPSTHRGCALCSLSSTDLSSGCSCPNLRDGTHPPTCMQAHRKSGTHYRNANAGQKGPITHPLPPTWARPGANPKCPPDRPCLYVSLPSLFRLTTPRWWLPKKGLQSSGKPSMGRKKSLRGTSLPAGMGALQKLILGYRHPVPHKALLAAA